MDFITKVKVVGIIVFSAIMVTCGAVVVSSF